MDNNYRSLRKLLLKETQPPPTSFTVVIATLRTPLTTLRITSPWVAGSLPLDVPGGIVVRIEPEINVVGRDVQRYIPDSGVTDLYLDTKVADR